MHHFRCDKEEAGSWLSATLRETRRQGDGWPGSLCVWTPRAWAGPRGCIVLQGWKLEVDKGNVPQYLTLPGVPGAPLIILQALQPLQSPEVEGLTLTATVNLNAQAPTPMSSHNPLQPKNMKVQYSKCHPWASLQHLTQASQISSLSIHMYSFPRRQIPQGHPDWQPGFRGPSPGTNHQATYSLLPCPAHIGSYPELLSPSWLWSWMTLLTFPACQSLGLTLSSSYLPSSTS